jgi:hypothetical protein
MIYNKDRTFQPFVKGIQRTRCSLRMHTIGQDPAVLCPACSSPSLEEHNVEDVDDVKEKKLVYFTQQSASLPL